MPLTQSLMKSIELCFSDQVAAMISLLLIMYRTNRIFIGLFISMDIRCIRSVAIGTIVSLKTADGYWLPLAVSLLAVNSYM